MSYGIVEIRELRGEVNSLKPAVRTRDNKAYEKMRDNMIVSFLPFATNTTQMTEKSWYKASLADDDGYLETVLYGEIWNDLLPNEQLAIEHLYYENVALVDEDTRFYTNMHAYVDAKREGSKELAKQHLKNTLWEVLYNTPFKANNVLERDNARRRRKAQATMLNTLNISTFRLPTPNYIVERVRQQYQATSLEMLLPDIVFPLEENARRIAEEIQAINAEIQQMLLEHVSSGQKSLVSDATTIPEATDAFAELTNTIVSGVYKKIEEETWKQAEQGKTETEITEHIDSVIAHYQDVTIPDKMNMLVTHFNGKLSEVRLQESGVNSYVWFSMDDEKVRPSHAANDGQIFSWDNPPPTDHPGHEHNCRCQAAPIQVAGAGKVVIEIIKQALKKSQGKVKDAAGKIRKNPLDKLNPAQKENLARFEKKLPKGAEPTKIKDLPDGKKVFQSDVPAKNIPGSFARYEKTVDATGKTVKYTKTTFGSDGKIIHVKDKF